MSQAAMRDIARQMAALLSSLEHWTTMPDEAVLFEGRDTEDPDRSWRITAGMIRAAAKEATMDRSRYTRSARSRRPDLVELIDIRIAWPAAVLVFLAAGFIADGSAISLFLFLAVGRVFGEMIASVAF